MAIEHGVKIPNRSFIALQMHEVCYCHIHMHCTSRHMLCWVRHKHGPHPSWFVLTPCFQTLAMTAPFKGRRVLSALASHSSCVPPAPPVFSGTHVRKQLCSCACLRVRLLVLMVAHACVAVFVQVRGCGAFDTCTHAYTLSIFLPAGACCVQSLLLSLFSAAMPTRVCQLLVKCTRGPLCCATGGMRCAELGVSVSPWGSLA